MSTQKPKHPDPDHLLAQIGVVDLDDGESYVCPHSTEAAAGSNLLVRGARRGGSPILNVLSRSVGVLVLLVLTGLGYGAWRLTTRADPPSPSAVDTFECKVRPWHRTAKGVVAMAVDVADGKVALPRDAAGLIAAGGETFTVDNDRVDRFAPTGAQMAIRYAGSSTRVRSVSVSFAEPRDRCAALRSLALHTGTARFRLGPDGVLAIVAGEAHPFFVRGVVRVRSAGESIAVVQFDAP